MKRSFSVLIMMMAVVVLLSGDALYSEEVYKDMYVSVVVLPAFRAVLDNANINFGFSDPGKSVELYPERNYNEIKCVSNKGTKWYLRIAVVGDIIGPQGTNVGIGSFKWLAASSSGDGIIEKGWHPFTKEPAQVYTSGLRDMIGDEVTIKFKYKLDLPKNALGGNYGINIIYTMTDTP